MNRGPKKQIDVSSIAGIMDHCALVPVTGCWLWLRANTPLGYGVTLVEGKRKKVHRLAWELVYGVIPIEICVCHTCDTPSCVNPDHLFLGTTADNNKDRHRKGRTITSRADGRHFTAKLDEEKVRAIRLDKRPRAEITAEYGVHITSIGLIQRGTTWSKVT